MVSHIVHEHTILITLRECSIRVNIKTTNEGSKEDLTKEGGIQWDY